MLCLILLFLNRTQKLSLGNESFALSFNPAKLELSQDVIGQKPWLAALNQFSSEINVFTTKLVHSIASLCKLKQLTTKRTPCNHLNSVQRTPKPFKQRL
jgi:hypothetical protein